MKRNIPNINQVRKQTITDTVISKKPRSLTIDFLADLIKTVKNQSMKLNSSRTCVENNGTVSAATPGQEISNDVPARKSALATSNEAAEYGETE